MNESVRKFGKRIISNIIGVFIFQTLFLFMGWAGVTSSNFLLGWIIGIFIWTILDYLLDAISEMFNKS